MSRKAKQHTIFNFIQDKKETIKKPDDIKYFVMNKLREEFDPKHPTSFKPKKPSTSHFKHRDLSFDPQTEHDQSVCIKGRQTIFSLYKHNEEPVKVRV